MLYLALLFAYGYEWMAVAGSEAEAKQKVFDGFNTFLMRQEEMKKGQTTTHEYLTQFLKDFYKKNLKGDVSIDTLINSKLYQLEVLEIEVGECYRNGHKVPSRIQDF